METLNQFGVNPILLAAQIVNFFILLWILKRFLYGPILRVLSERRKKIEESLKNAQEIEQRLLETEEQKEKILAKATADAQKILDEVKKERDALREETRQMAADEAAVIIKKAQDEARLEKERMMAEVRRELATIVGIVLQKITGKVLVKEEEKKLLEKEIKNIS